MAVGTSSKIFRAFLTGNEKHLVAIKVINTKDMNLDDLSRINTAVDTMRQVDHPNVVKFFELYKDKHHLYIVMELCEGGDLLRRHEEFASEQKAAELMKKVLMTLVHLHGQGIIHQDLKPDNIMFKEEEPVLIDFGFMSLES